VIEEYLPILQKKAVGQIEGTVKLVVADEGEIWLDETGARATDTAEGFIDIFSGEQNPMTAYMSRSLKVDGSTARALKVSEVLTDD